VLTRAIETNGVFHGTTIARGRDMESIEALKLRRMRVRNEISLSTEEGAGRAEDLEALHEELSSLSKQIEDAEDQRSPRQTLPRERLYKAMAGNRLE
jgi:hypothetical protein